MDVVAECSTNVGIREQHPVCEGGSLPAGSAQDAWLPGQRHEGAERVAKAECDDDDDDDDEWTSDSSGDWAAPGPASLTEIQDLGPT